MIKCNKCSAEYPTERLFCGKCKERLGIRCSVCGFINLLDDLHCGICLTEIKSQGAVPGSQESAKPVSAPESLYAEIQESIQEDETFTGIKEQVSQREIEDIFQKDEES